MLHLDAIAGDEGGKDVGKEKKADGFYFRQVNATNGRFLITRASLCQVRPVWDFY